MSPFRKSRATLFLPAEFAGGDLDVRRADVSRVLADAAGKVGYRFSESVRALHQFPDRMHVVFERGPPEKL